MILYGGVDFQQEERDAINRVLDRNWWGLDKEGDAFERELEITQEVKHAIFVTSGSMALELGIAASNLPKGSEVIVPATTFSTPIASLIRHGLVPVVVDVDEYNFIDYLKVQEAITDKTKAILAVYVAGNVGHLTELLGIAQRHNLEVWEDNCDGLGGTYHNKPLGSFGRWSATSTHAAHIICTGQGGVLFTNDDEINDRVRKMRDWGRNLTDHDNLPPEHQRYVYTETGYNAQPLELQAAMGRVQLRKLKQFKEARQHNFNYLYENLRDVVLPAIREQAQPCWHTFPILVDDRPKVVKKLDTAKIDWRPLLAGNIARQPYYADKVRVSGTLERAGKNFYNGLWLPIHPSLSINDMETICTVLQ